VTRVLVTGGTGVLGSAIVRQLQTHDVAVRVLSRRERPNHGQIEWVSGDLTTGAGLEAAFAGVDVVVHSATSQKAKEDLVITRRVLEAAKTAGTGHALYVSIVGIDRLGFFDYYAAKLEGEKLFAASGMPYAIQRATQFHDFVAMLLTMLGRAPVLLLPRGVTLQPVDPEAVAVQIARAALGRVAGRLPDLAGPEVRSLEDLAVAWLHAQGKRKRMVSLPMPLPIFRAMGSGQLTSEEAERIGQTWEVWLEHHVSSQNSDQRVRVGGT
jgi:uncharacterized protein YbjT (DUF2867 family)